VVLTPICPHSLALRPLVVPDTRRLEVELASRRDEEVYLAIDGQEKTTLRFGDLVRVTHCPEKVRLVKASGRNFHHNLREKLRWGGLDDLV
jgi:NAD+ kinase